MKILTETKLRSEALPEGTPEYRVEADVFITPMAKEYLRDRGIKLVVVDGGLSVPEKKPDVPPVMRPMAVMTRTPLPNLGQRTYVDARTGQGYSEKPEYMTHLRGNVLVPKTHPRIAFRGQLDSLEADIICLQTDAWERGYQRVVDDMDEILKSVQKILGAEVKEEPLAPMDLLGLDDAGLRRVSHHVKENIGIDHPIPNYKMGKIPAQINQVRTRVRETELAAAQAFIDDEGKIERADIIQQLNRLSSAVYIVFCRFLAGYYEGGSK